MMTETNKGKILDILFDSPKTTAELAHELGYVNSEGNALYNVIDKDLKKLVENKYLKRAKVKKEPKSGNTPTLYSINFSVQKLRNMIKEYPYLISKMRRNDSVLEAILNQYSNCRYLNIEKYKINVNIKKHKINENIEKHKINENIEKHKKIYHIFCIAIDKEDLKKRSHLSEEFFKLILINNTDQLAFHTWILANTFNENLNTKYYNKENNLNDKIVNLDNEPTKQEINFGLDVAFKACVVKDIMDGKSNTNAIEYLSQMESKVSNETNRVADELFREYEVSTYTP